MATGDKRVSKKRAEMTDLAERLERAGCRIIGWWWIEQGGPCWSPSRPPANGEGEYAEPVVLGSSVRPLLPPEEADDGD